MRVKIGNQKTAQYVIRDGSCFKCVFYSEALSFCASMNCDINGFFDQTGTLEDIFKL